MAGYRMTPARRAALKKAQLASAKKRKGTGKAKASTVRRRSTKATSSRVRRRRAAVAVAAVGAAAGAGYVYKNRERLIVAKAAEHFAVRSAKAAARAQGKKLGKAQIRKVRLEERKNHANRSRYRVQEYKLAREWYQIAAKNNLNLRPQKARTLRGYEKAVLTLTGNRRSIRSISSKNSIHNKLDGMKSASMQQYMYDTYRKDVNARATSRLNRMKGKKQGFSYKSGKTKKVISGRVYRMPF